MGLSAYFLSDISTSSLGILLVVAIVVLFLYLWHKKESQDVRTFTVTREGLNQQSEQIADLLSRMKLSKTEINTALLLVEELVMRFEQQASQTVLVRVDKSFGDVQLFLSADGDEYNPFEDMTSWKDESEDSFRDLLFRAHKEKLAYARRGRKNCVSVLAHSASSRSLYYTFIAMIGGIAFGYLLKYFPIDSAKIITESVLGTIETLFMNALMLILAPLLFLSMVNSFSGLSSAKEIGRLSGKVIGIFLLTTLATVAISFAMTYLFFSSDVPQLPERFLEADQGVVKSAEKNISLAGVLVSIIPRNIINPITELNMLQIIFVSIFFGVALSSLGDKTSHIRTIFSEIYEVFLKMVSMVVSFMPLVAFAAMALLVYSSKAESLVVLVKLLVLIATGLFAIILMYAFLIMVIGKISPVPYLRKLPEYLVNPFMLASSTACIPITIDFCMKKLGISKKITIFTVPLGATINMSGTALFLSVMLVLLGKMCGIEFTLMQLIKFGFLIVLFSVGCAGVPNSGVITLALVISSAGIPVGAIGFFLGIFNLVDRILTCANVNGDAATAVIVASSEGQLEKEVYQG